MLKNEGKNTKNTITYRQVGDYLIPNLTLPPEERNINLGKWGMKHKTYLMENNSVLFNSLLGKGKLYTYLAKVDEEASALFSRLVDDMAKAEGVTEQLKAADQMEWVGRMHNIHHRAEEIVDRELIYK